ncbi:MAG: DUF1565 domain-containing protein, partial [Coriobacteriia bacterium]|nr:DUF1565 domain-containing protein [Coriobacteriia bacterium]
MSVFKAASVRQRIVVMLTLIVLMASMIPVQPVVAVPSPMTYYVDVATGDDVAAGTEAEPLLSITHALELAYPGDTVVVAPGTYSSSESTSSGETFPLVLRDGVTLISAGDADDTTIDPELNSNAISHADLSVLTISAESASDPAVIEGFTIA